MKTKQVTVMVPIQMDLVDDNNGDFTMQAQQQIDLINIVLQNSDLNCEPQIMNNALDKSDITVDTVDDEGRDMDTDNPFELEYEGEKYPAREIYIDRDWGIQTISVISLSDLLIDEASGQPINDAAGAMDGDIFHYVDDSEINLPLEDLRELVKDNI